MSQTKNIAISAAVLGSFLVSTSAMFAYGHFTTASVTDIEGSQPAPVAVDTILRISMKEKHWQQLVEEREAVLESNIMLSEQVSFVPVELTYNGKTVRAKMRLKGDWTDHLRSNQWSYRVKVSGDQTIMGMKSFSLQHPQTRHWLNEYVLHELARQQDIVALRYSFVPVAINGEGHGLYAIEEHFEKRLVENNRRREGPILKFNEDNLWARRKNGNPRENNRNEMMISPIETFNQSSIADNPTQFKYYMNAVQLLEGLRTGEMTPSEVVDIERYAWFYALADLLGSHHMRFWHNLRFYYNPITAKIEPISYDGMAGTKIHATIGERNDDPFYRILASDEAFARAYAEKLYIVSSDDFLEKSLANVPKLHEYKQLLHEFWPDLKMVNLEAYKANREKIKKQLRFQYLKHIEAHVQSLEKNRLEIAIGNIEETPIEVYGLSYKDEMIARIEPQYIAGRNFKNPVSYHSVYFDLPAQFSFAQSAQLLDKIKVHYRAVGAQDTHAESLSVWPKFMRNFSKNDTMRKPPNAHTFPFVITNSLTKSMVLQPGHWKVDRDLIFPDNGYTVYCAEGTVIDLVEQAMIVSYAPIRCNGRPESPAIFTSSDRTGQGIAVMNAKQESYFSHVVFQQLNAANRGSWELTGALTFYESPVNFSHVTVTHMNAEDALNFVGSRYQVHDSTISHTRSDALDGDFSKGTLSNVQFSHCGNDCLDISGSTVTARSISVESVGDKGISVGEKSYFKGTDIQVTDANIGLAAKDISKVDLESIAIRNSNIGIAAYQKKSEFGAAGVNIEAINIIETKVPYATDTYSAIRINDIVQATEHLDPATLY